MLKKQVELPISILPELTKILITFFSPKQFSQISHRLGESCRVYSLVFIPTIPRYLTTRTSLTILAIKGIITLKKETAQPTIASIKGFGK